uniref:Ycf36 n=1 Tax=Haraldiophyllum bonnemaisonii TaxID=167977 RepID=A0A4D6WX72_9FLOR|nr:hypothetical protein [Haraldiophyllum bonnemaisonii]
MSIPKKNCPVPFDQQPLNEYLSLKKSSLFLWSTYDTKDYSIVLLLLFLILFVFCGCFLFLFFINEINLYKIFIFDLLIVNIILFFICIRLYLGWSYIVKRLLSATVFYEESGWYDGQVWVKTVDSLMQDRLIGLYQIMPYIIRIRYTCLIVCLSCLLYLFLYKLF